MNKDELRKEFVDRRQALSRDQIDNYNHKILEHFISFKEWLPNETVHIFISSSHHKEVNTRVIIEFLWTSNIHTLVPRLKNSSLEMEQVLFNPTSDLRKNQYGIDEPLGEPVHSQDYSMVVVPLLAIDSKGNRLGYGKGYYDKFLAGLDENTLKLGLSFFDPISENIPSEAHDIPLDVCISPSGAHHFTS